MFLLAEKMGKGEKSSFTGAVCRTKEALETRHQATVQRLLGGLRW